MARIKKALVAALALVGQAVAAGVLEGNALAVAQVVLAVAGVLGVYQVRNARPL